MRRGSPALTTAQPCSTPQSFPRAQGRHESVAPLDQVFQQGPVHVAIHPGADPAPVPDVGCAKESNLVDQELLETILGLHRDTRTAAVNLEHRECFLADPEIGVPPGLDLGDLSQ